MTLNQWVTLPFTNEEISNANDGLHMMKDMGLSVFFDYEYGVVSEMQVTTTSALEKTVVMDWFEYLSSNEQYAEQKLYKIAKYIYDKKNVSFIEADDEYKAVGRIYDRLKAILGYELYEQENSIVALVVSYISKVRKQGILGIECLSAGDIDKKYGCLERYFNLYNVFRKVKYKASAILAAGATDGSDNPLNGYVTKEQQSRYIITLLSIIDKDERYRDALANIIGEVSQYGFLPTIEKNVNLGMEELQLIFMDKGNLHCFDKPEASAEDSYIAYKSLEDIGDFLYDYIMVIRDLCVEKNKTARNIIYNMAQYNAVVDTYESLIYKILDEIGGACESLDRSVHFSDRIPFDGNVYKKYMEALKDGKNKRIHLKIMCVEQMAEKNFWNLIKVFDSSKGKLYLNALLKIDEYALELSEMNISLAFLPQESLHENSIHENYALALSRRKEITKYKKYFDIWESLLMNYFGYCDNELSFMPCVLKYEGNKQWLSDFNDTELSMMLEGKRIGNIAKRKAIVERIGGWINDKGVLKIEINSVEDFKAIYDVIYKFKPKAHLKEGKINIGINSFKKKDAIYDELARDEQVYLILGVFLSKLYNRRDISMNYFIEITNRVKYWLNTNTEFFDVINYDYIMVLVNLFRERWEWPLATGLIERKLKES